MKQLLQSRASGRGPEATNALLRWLCLPLAALCAALATPAGAAPYTFSGLSTTTPYGLNMHHWPDAANWSPLTGPPVGAPSHDVTFPTLPPGLLTGFGGVVINDGPLVTLHDITFNATHAYFIALSNCAPMQINGTLTKHGAFAAAIHGHNGRLHLNNPVLAGTGTEPLFVFRPESIMGSVTVNGGRHEWHIGSTAFCAPGTPPPVFMGSTFTASGGNFRLLSDVNVPFTGAFDVSGGVVCVKSLSGGPITLSALNFSVSGGTLNLGAGVTYVGPFTVGAAITPGCSIATANIVGDLTFTSTGTVECELGPPGSVGGPDNDLFNITGNLTLDGTLLVVPQAGFGPGTYRLFNYSSTLVNNGMTINGLPAGLSGTLNTTTPGQVNLIVANADCCASCTAPYPASLTVSVAPGINFLVNPFCHGAANALGSIIANPPDGATLFKFDKSTQAYSDPFTYDSGFGGWVDINLDPASSTVLPPGEGFLFNNPGATAFSLTFTGCEPDCGPRCPPTNGLCLVGRTGAATNAVIWEHLFNCPPVCGSFVSIFNGTSFDTYTFLNTGWSPATPTWAAGSSVFVGLTNCLSCAPLPACAVAYWKAESNAQDSFSNHHGSALNGTAYVPGASGQAWSFDGMNDYVHVPYSSPLNVVNGLTLAAWVRPAANPPTTAVIAGRPLGYQLDMLPNGKARFAITIGPSMFASVDSPQPLPLNQFSFVAGTYDPATGELRIYTNCNLAASITVPAGSRALYHRPNAPFQIGGFNDPTIPFTGGFLHGRVDDVTLFGCALSQQELNARCAAGAAGWCCPPPCTNALLLVCPQDIIVPNDPGLCSAVVQYVPPTAIGGCSPNVTVTCTPPSGLFPVGTTTVTCVATNEAGQSVQCTFRVTVRDTEPPRAANCQDLVLPQVFPAGTMDNFAGPEPAAPSAGVQTRLTRLAPLKGFDDCTLNRFMAHTFANLPICISEAKLTVRLKACGDICDNDSFGLYFIAPDGSAQAGGWGRFLGAGNASAGITDQDWCDNTAGVTLTLDLAALPMPDGSTFNQLPFLNRHGFLDFTVQDDTAVDFVQLEVKSCCCRADLVVDAPTNACFMPVSYTTPPIMDNCPGSLSVICSPPSGASFPVGTTTVICSATDAAGNVGKCAFNVVVRSHRPPLVECPAGTILVPTSSGGLATGLVGDCTIEIPQIQVKVTDPCWLTPLSNFTITQNPPAYSRVPALNSYIVTVTVTDGYGNSKSCQVVVAGVDRTPPVLNCPASLTVNNCRLPNLSAAASATDNCTPAHLLKYTQSPAAGQIVGPGAYPITVTVRDAAGNVSQCRVLVNVVPSPGTPVPLTVWNTGLDHNGNLLPSGAVDPHYKLITPSPISLTYATPPDPSWLPNDTVSKWITPYPSLIPHRPSSYVYQQFVDLTGLDPATAVLTGRWTTDDAGVVTLNGIVATSGSINTLGPNPWKTFTITGPFIPGMNRIEFTTFHSLRRPTGIRVEISGTANCLPCHPPVFTWQSPNQLSMPGGSAVFSVTATGTAPLSYRWYFNGTPLSDDLRHNGTGTRLMVLNNAGYADAGYYHVVVSNICGVRASRRIALNVRGGWRQPWANWSFANPDSPLSADFGPDLTITGMTNSGITFGTTEDFGIPGPAGRIVTVMRVPELTTNTTVHLPFIAPPGVSNLSAYSLIMDLYAPTNGAENVRPLFAPNPATNGLLFSVRAMNPLREEGFAPGSLSPVTEAVVQMGTWNRVALVAQRTGDRQFVTAFRNGQTVDPNTPLAGEPVKGVDVNLDQDPGGALFPAPLGGGIGGGAFSPANMMDDGLYVANIQFHAVALTSQEIAGLGGPASAGLPFGPPLLPSIPVLQASLVGGQLHLSWTGDGFTLESSTALEAGDWAPVELPFASVAVGDETRHTAFVEEPTGLEPARFYRLALTP